MSIRRATDADLDALIAMGRMLHDESPRYQDMAFSPAKLRRQFAHLKGTVLTEPGAVFIAEKAGETIGMAVCITAERWFSEEIFVTDLTLFLKSEHRGGIFGPLLVRAMERWAAEQGIYDLAFGVSTLIHADQTVAMYERMGYQLAGYTMVKRNGH